MHNTLWHRSYVKMAWLAALEAQYYPGRIDSNSQPTTFHIDILKVREGYIRPLNHVSLDLQIDRDAGVKRRLS